MQKLIAERFIVDFSYLTNQYLNQGFNVVPGTVYSVPLNRKATHLFSVTLWKEGYETTLNAEEFDLFVKNVAKYLRNKYSVVIGTLYATDMRRKEGYSDESKDYDNYYFNFVNKELSC